MMYVQCQLKRNNEKQVSWIAEKFAVKGKVLDFKENGVWDRGWVVTETFSKLRAEDAIANSQLHKHHRKGTDI